MIEKLLLDNPILIKHYRARMRRAQLRPTVIIVFLLASCLLWAGWEGQGLTNGVIFWVIYVLMAIVMQFGGTSQVASSMGQTNDSGILDFHRISPLPPSVATVGFILGAPIREWLVVAVMVPFALFCAILGSPGILGFLQCMLILITTNLLFHTFAVSSGLLVRKGKSRSASGGIIVLLVIASLSSPTVYNGIPIPGLLTVGPTMLDCMEVKLGRGDVEPTFFGAKLPIFLQTLCYQLPLLAFLFVAAVRRMRSPQLPLYSKLNAAGFLVTISILNLAGLVGHPKLVPEQVVPSLLYINVVVAVLLTLSVTPELTTFRNGIRRSRKIGMVKPAMWTDSGSNRAVLFVFCGVTWATAQSVVTFLAANIQFDQTFLLMTMTAMCTIAHFGGGLQYFKLKFGRRGKVTMFLFCFLFWFLPLIIAGIVRFSVGPKAAEYVASISPIFGIAKGTWTALIPSALMAVIFAALCLRQEKIVHDSVDVEMDDPNYFIDDET